MLYFLEAKNKFTGLKDKLSASAEWQKNIFCIFYFPVMYVHL